MVIAIITLLAALLLPALYRAKEAGYTTVCRSNLRQLGIALESYADDFKVYPVYAMNRGDLLPPENTLAMWHQQLERYSGAKPPAVSGVAISGPPRTQLYLCPSCTRATRVVGAVTNNFFPFFGSSYGYNYRGTSQRLNQTMGLGGDFLAPDPSFTYQYRPTRATEVLKPSLMIAIGDGLMVETTTPSGRAPQAYPDLSEGLAYFDVYGIPPDPSEPFSTEEWGVAQKRHGGRWNVVFCDGHVEIFKTRSLFDPKETQALSRWNKDNIAHRDMLPK